MRQRIAAVLLALIALASAFTRLDLAALRPSVPAQPSLVSSYLQRLGCVTQALPQGVQHFGYLPAIDLIVRPAALQNTTPGMDLGSQFTRFYMARYAVTPRLISRGPDRPWIIAYYPDAASGLAAIRAQGLTVVKDCRDGLFLVRR